MTTRTRAVLLTLSALALVGACGSPATGGGTVSSEPAGPPQATTAEPAPQPDTATFGQRYTWPSGLAVDVKAPEPFKPSSSAAGNDQGRAVLVTTTITNGTTEPYAFNVFIVGPTATHAGQAATSVFDIEKKIGGAPLTTILPGKSFTYKAAFSIGKDPGEMQLQYTEAFGSGPAIFVGNI